MFDKETDVGNRGPQPAGHPDRQLPSRFWDAVIAMPECAMGVSKVIVTLQDGSRIRDVFVMEGHEIVRVGREVDLPFRTSDIIKVESQR